MNTPMKTYHLCALICLLVVTMMPINVSADNPSVPARLASESLLLGAAKAGANLLVVGERGHVLRSTDQGKSWQQIVVPTQATLTAVTFVNALHGWAVGHDLTILKTADGGVSWHLVHQDMDEQPPLLTVLFLDQNNGFALGAYGTFLETDDGGATWEQRWISADDFHFNAITAVGDHLFIAAEAGMVYRSDDQGETFVELTPDYSGSFFGLLPLDGTSLLLFGLRGHLFRSDDLGENWQQLPTATEAGLTTGLKLKDGTLLIAGLSGALLVSTDQGHNFSSRQDPDRKGFSQLFETSSGNVFAVGDFGVSSLPSGLFK